MRVWRIGVCGVLAFFLHSAALVPASFSDQKSSVRSDSWSDTELVTLRSLWIGSLAPLPPDPSNAVGDDPRAVRLGHRLFFDTQFSSDGQVACATCHIPALSFTDGRKLGRGVGTAGRNTMTILGAAYSPWFFWDGRKDSQWSQALGPMESAVEHGGNRTKFAHILASEAEYRAAYKELFGEVPDLSGRNRFPLSAGPVADPQSRAAWQRMTAKDRDTVSGIFANIGKVIAAYERRIVPGPSRFDRYVEAVLAGDERAGHNIFSEDEVAGLRLFIGRGQCVRCHNGPLFTNNDFHNTGVPRFPSMPDDKGRSAGVTAALADEFNCLGKYSDAEKNDCNELRFAKTGGPELLGAMKTPTLRSISKTWPYMHAGQHTTLELVLDHYNRAPSAQIGMSELNPLGLTRAELTALRKFLLTLDSPPDVKPDFLSPPS